MTLTFGSLFAGIGGFDAGFEAAGMRCLWQVEIDSSCRDILARHFSDAERYVDVLEVSGATLPPVDVITFGSPCQDLSVAGQRRGLAGERSGLYFEAMRIIQEMRDATDGRCPTLALWENVEGALSSHRGRDFGAALDALAACGALDIGWSVLDSQYFAVAQRRRRVFVVADFGGERSGEILALTESLCGNPAPGRTAWQDIAGPLGQVASSGGGHRLDIDSAGAYVVQDEVSLCLKAKGHASHDPTHETYVIGGDVTHALRAEGADASEDGTGRGTPIVAFAPFDLAQITSKINRLDVRYGREAPPLNTTGQAHAAIAFQPTQDATGHDDSSPAVTNSHGGSPAVAFSENQRGEVVLSDYAHQLTAGGGKLGQGYPAAQHGMTVRRLTPTECERLQGFPDGWTAVGASGKAMSDSVRYRMLGNAVTVNVAAWIGKRIVMALSAIEGAVA